MDEQTQFTQQVDHCLNALYDTVQVLHNNGVTPAAIATALATGYIHYVTTICVAMNIPREQVLDHAVAALRQLDKYADEVFTKCLAEKEKFDNEQQ